MKKQFLILSLLLGLSFLAKSNDSISSKIVFYREYNFQGSALSYNVFLNDSAIVRLKNNSYFEYNCSPGIYNLIIDKFQETKLSLKVEKNKTYYLRFGLRTGFWSAFPEFIIVDSISAYPAITSGSMRVLDKNNTPLPRPKNRLGLNLNIGGGFDNMDLIKMQNEDNSSLSFGGGVALGLKYGHEFSKYFDLAIDLNWQESELRPTLSNATVTFDRFYTSITPSFILPIKGGDAMRIKFGAGADFYWGNLLTIETSKLSDGYNDNWKYKNTAGYHVSAIFELNVSEKWSFNYGVKYYNVNYEFESSSKYTPGDKLTKTDGSGLDLLIGIYYGF